MSFPLLPEIVLVVSLLTVLGLILIVGLDRLWRFRVDAIDRFKGVFPYLLLLGGVLAVNSYLRRVGPSLSWVFGWQITDDIFAIEGNFVGIIQSYSNPIADLYFSYIYIYGYIFLVAFPVLAYFVLSDERPIREITLAYTINYVVGVLCYLVFIAYGPRNVMPDLVDQILYLNWPESNLLTTDFNANVNVFPSLHTSLSMTVALLAYRTRKSYPLWVPVSSILAVSVMISTMYLGIHWGTDVVAGIGLAVFSVGGASWLVSPERRRLRAIGERLRAPIDRMVDWFVDLVREYRQTNRSDSRLDS
ncbi:MAG: phosphatase PAP2 family protein [Halovenus sp.]|uniref:phosphatase PAP2 family protein n=1 Tax=Halovenus amylolytica TaxID=2500550 RepID=UPI000FE41281